MPAPQFIYVGTPKSGSTWLFEAFRSHPDAYVLPSKSSGNFDGGKHLSRAEYCALYSDAGRGQVCGEIAHDAFLQEDTAARLAREFPDIRILFCLREPAEYTRSTLTWWKTHTRRFGRNLDEMVASRRFRAGIDYHARLAAFYAHFPAEQIGVLFLDQLRDDPAAFAQQAYAFVGIDPAHVPSVVAEQVNAARPPLHPALTRAVYAGGGIARAVGLGNLVERIKAASLTQAMLYRNKSEGPDEHIERLAAAERERAQPMIERLETMTALAVPDNWRG